MTLLRLYRGAALALAFTALAVGVAGAEERWALLIGASDYASEEGGAARNWLSLDGPRNDVALMYSTLVGDGVPRRNIRVLADTLDRSVYKSAPAAEGRPVRDEILRSLDWLAEHAKPNDQALIYYSGHGAFVPEKQDKPGGPTEDDGKDEILVPLGVGYWDEQVEAVSGQVLDDELGQKVRALMDNGVFVWLVVDACHSGTAVRSAEQGEGRVRRVDPVADLGVPKEALDAARRRAGKEASTRSGDVWSLQSTVEALSPKQAGFVAFYAAHPAQYAIERLLPKGASLSERRSHGVMTWNLAQALRASGAADYATLARQVAAGYWEWGPTAPMPQFEGELSATPMIGAGSEKTWGISTRDGNLLLEAGQLDNIGAGTILEIHQKGDSAEEPLFYARVDLAGIEEAKISPLPATNARPSLLEERMIRDGVMNSRSRERWFEDRSQSFLAKVIDRTPAFVLQVAMTGATEELALAKPVIEDVTARGAGAEAALELVSSAEDADVLLSISNGRLWFTPPGAALVEKGPQRAYSLTLADLNSEVLSHALRQIARARNLSRTAEAYSNTPTARSLSTEVHIRQGRHLADGSCENPPLEPTALPADVRLIADGAHPLTDFVTVRHCDQVFYSFTNTGQVLLDLTPLYIDPWSQVSFLDGFRESTYGGLRLRPGETRILTYAENTSSSGGRVTPVGAGEVVVVVTVGDAERMYAPDFRHLADEMPGGQRRDAGAPEGLRALLQDAAFGNVRAAAGEPIGRSGVIAIPFKTEAPR